MNKTNAQLAEGLGTGLQNRARGFESLTELNHKTNYDYEKIDFAFSFVDDDFRRLLSIKRWWFIKRYVTTYIHHCKFPTFYFKNLFTE